MDLIKRGVSEIIPEEELIKKLERSSKEGIPLNIKLGCDPSRPDLHIGHSVVLRKLAQFQTLGHQAILIIGDFTGMIGDPSGRNATRPSLTLKETREHGQSYFQQASKILDAKKTKIVYNSEWLGKMSFEDVIKLAAKYTVARMLERDDFTKRYKAGEPISIHELLYPLAQAMDSVAIKSDVELGGTDQKFNLLVGRDIQREHGQEPQIILTMPLLVGTDGVEKMSKSYDNYIGISESPKEIFGKTLSIPDSLIYTYFELATDISTPELLSIKHQLEDSNFNPRDIKRKLARTLVRMYHNEESAIQAQEEFDRIFIKKEIPDEVEEFKIENNNSEINILDLILKVNFAPSRGEARRLVTQGGVSIENKKITDANFNIILTEGMVLKVGKRKFIKFIK
ncbi:MAG: tyrosine--tRNA ligase [Ignavibacteriota bacterium]|jgi:tyrosyl-tRNA synthetase|nr:MAG: tyrosine--tRNA ligase [Chlorobiota bacterium]MBE7478155.1 tyrosine--tRNA ligase [Ignavibacteriales bacterium]MBL1121615.1 tyrosine--tRNA ligase [Ignavibacteriota bacterium]MCC7093806.1 tyrosine--tRNA ligase [Ignavibacteriaceae bacterium]MCE7856755.1 tyrosine--tRNA ligase [Ignavibacteria bacterium CHB3]MEB2297079.1 tyrosine--tRNA ligase [Ignavibacteria bacterium]